MKHIHCIIVFLVIVGCAVVSGVDSYCHTKQAIVNDMNQALAKTLALKQECTITPDTIRDYRNFLRLKPLREYAYVYYAMGDKGNAICGRPMAWKSPDDIVEFQSYAHCTVASIISMSDMRLPLSLSVAAMLWLAFCVRYLKRHREGMVIFGNMMWDTQQETFCDLRRQPITLTPMQEQLLRMFFLSPEHRLGKQEICDSLWPKKPDASETLYTLIRRLRPIIKEQGNLGIVSERGKDYQLRIGEE